VAVPIKRANALAVEGDGPDSASRVRADIHSLSELAPNWDGYGAPAIDPAVIEAAEAFIARLPQGLAPPPRVVPMSNGTLQLEWHAGPKSLELEFESPDSIRYLQWHPNEGVEEEDAFPTTNVETAVDLIRWFLTRPLGARSRLP